MGISFGKENVFEEECELSTPVRRNIRQTQFDPRSPSIGIDRTPIQHPHNTAVLEDPRSPSLHVTRTPIVYGNVGRNTDFTKKQVLVDSSDVKNKPECSSILTISESVEPGVIQEETIAPIPEPEAADSKDCIKLKLQFDSTPPSSMFPVALTRSPLTTRNCYPDQPVEIVKRKQLRKVAERLSHNPASDKENCTR